MPKSHSSQIFVHCLKNLHDPRSKQGQSHPFPTIMAIVLLGLLANVSTPTEIARWAKIHLSQLKQFLRIYLKTKSLKNAC